MFDLQKLYFSYCGSRKVRDPIIRREGWDLINQCHPATFCVRPKPGPAFLIAYVTVYFVLNGLR